MTTCQSLTNDLKAASHDVCSLHSNSNWQTHVGIPNKVFSPRQIAAIPAISLPCSTILQPPEERVCKASSKTMFPCSESIGWTWKSVGDQRSYEQERIPLSMTKLCNLAAAPQMSVRYSRCTPVGLLKICHLVVSNPKAISTFVLSWLKQMLWV